MSTLAMLPPSPAIFQLEPSPAVSVTFALHNNGSAPVSLVELRGEIFIFRQQPYGFEMPRIISIDEQSIGPDTNSQTFTAEWQGQLDAEDMHSDDLLMFFLGSFKFDAEEHHFGYSKRGFARTFSLMGPKHNYDGPRRDPE